MTDTRGRARQSGIDSAWLASQQEDIIEPALPICDPHHHLWDYPASRYLLPELLADIGGGHNIESTVFVECGAFYRSGGPSEFRPIRRCMFGSNFPVAKASRSYSTLWNAFKRLAAGASPDEKAALFRDTAMRFYRLGGEAR